MQDDELAHLVAEILNACYPVRHYGRPCTRAQRAAAIVALGLVVRRAFARSSNFEPLLRALVEGLVDDQEPLTWSFPVDSRRRRRW